MTQGVYALIIENNKEASLQIGQLGTFLFLKGLFIYVGSALGKTSTSLEHRLKRHLSSVKKMFWHIDFFLNFADVNIVAVLFAKTPERKECELASALSQLEGAQILVSRFGSSDCMDNCGSHLFYFTLELKKLKNLCINTFSKLNLQPNFLDFNTFPGELNL